MSLIALLLLFAPAGAGSAAPTSQEFVVALAEHTGAHVNAADLRRLSCTGFGAEELTEAECRWQQRVGGKWKRYSTYVGVDRRGWHLIDQPKQER